MTLTMPARRPRSSSPLRLARRAGSLAAAAVLAACGLTLPAAASAQAVTIRAAGVPLAAMQTAAQTPAVHHLTAGFNGRCLDGDGGGTRNANGAIVQLWDCNTNAWQGWVLDTDHRIRNLYSGRCLDADGGGTRNANGAIVQLWDCNTNAWQKWRTTASGQLVSLYNGRCLDADRNGSHAALGALLQLWDCNANGWQRWSTAFSALNAGDALPAGHGLVSPSGGSGLAVQADGNLVIYQAGRAVWASGTHGTGADLEMQSDGNLVLYRSGHVAVWGAGTAGTDLHADLTDAGALRVLVDESRVRWSSATDLRTRIVALATAELSDAPNNQGAGTGGLCNSCSAAPGVGTPCTGPGGAARRSQAGCADFARWVLRGAGASITGTTSAASSFEAYGRTHNTLRSGADLSLARPGDVVLFAAGGSVQHVGIVTSTGVGRLTMIDGNNSSHVVRSTTLTSAAYGSQTIVGFVGPAA